MAAVIRELTIKELPVSMWSGSRAIPRSLVTIWATSASSGSSVDLSPYGIQDIEGVVQVTSANADVSVASPGTWSTYTYTFAASLTEPKATLIARYK